jgi:rare lipoprotein A
MVLAVAGCGSTHKRVVPESAGTGTPSASGSVKSSAAPAAAGKRPGGYYQDDGPGDNPPPNLDAIPDAVPRAEPLRAAANKPYAVFGHEYVPQTSLKPFKQRGVASWYGRKFNGAQTSSGEIYDMYGMTAAPPTLPIPSYAKVTNLANSRSVIVRVNDRGPFLSERIMDLSYAAAYKLGYVRAGSAQVEVETINPATFVPTAVAKNAPPPDKPPAGSGAPVVNAPIAKAAVADSVVENSGASAGAPVVTATLPALPSTPAAPAVTLPVATDASGVYLQLGAFSQRDNAEAFRTRVYQRLDWLNDTIAIKPGDGLYRLHLGPYRDRAEAERMAARIREALELKPTVIVK